MAFFTKRCLSPLNVILLSILFSLYFSIPSFAQFQIENCGTTEFELIDSCNQKVLLKNRMLPIDGIAMDSFKVDIGIDLWNDGTIDQTYRTDTTGLSGEIHHPKVSSLEEILLEIPVSGISQHRIYWNFINDDGIYSSCTQDLLATIDFKIIGIDTVTYLHNTWTNFVYLDDIDFSSVQFYGAVADCGFEPMYCFGDDDKISPAACLFDYNLCDTFFSYINYHTVYYSFDLLGCQEKEDSLVLKIYNFVNSYAGLQIKGNCSTIANNTVTGIQSEEECDISFSNNFINSCDPYIFGLIDDFFPGETSFNIYKEDKTTRGLTCRDLLLVRQHLLSNDSLDAGLLFAGDVNENGSISTLDVVLLNRMILMKDAFEYQIPWLFKLDFSDSPGIAETQNANEFTVNEEFLDDSWTEEFGLKAYKKGDFDGSYYNEINNDVICSFNEFDSIGVQLTNRSITAGEEFSLPIILNKDVEIQGIHFGLSSNLVQDINLQSGVLEVGSNFNAVDSNFVFIWEPGDFSAINYQKGEILFWITLTAKEDFQLVDLFTDSPEFPRELYDNNDFTPFTFKFGEYGLSDLADIESNLDLTIFPNPFEHQFLIQLDAGNLNEVSISVYNLEGRLVYHRFRDKLAEGATEMIRIEEAAAVYVIKVACKEGAFSKRIISL